MDIDKLKALALAATPGPWSAIEWTCAAPTTVRAGAVGITVADTTGHGRNSEVCAIDAAFIAAFNPATVLELIAEVEKLRARFGYIEGNATTHGGGHGFTVSFFVPEDSEDIGCGIDAAIGAHTKAGKEPETAHTNDEFSKVKE